MAYRTSRQPTDKNADTLRTNPHCPTPRSLALNYHQYDHHHHHQYCTTRVIANFLLTQWVRVLSVAQRFRLQAPEHSRPSGLRHGRGTRNLRMFGPKRLRR